MRSREFPGGLAGMASQTSCGGLASVTWVLAESRNMARNVTIINTDTIKVFFLI
jgi:hypothetical protein